MTSLQHTRFGDDSDISTDGAVPYYVRDAIGKIQEYGVYSDAKYAFTTCICGCKILKKCHVCTDKQPNPNPINRKNCELCKDLGIEYLEDLVVIRDSFNVLIKYIADILPDELPPYLDIFNSLANSVVNRRKKNTQAEAASSATDGSNSSFKKVGQRQSDDGTAVGVYRSRDT
jgi:hypothetical protein